MKLRKLEEKDAPLMLEWMHDESVVEYLQTNFAAKTIKDCLSFIESSQDTLETLNLAIADDTDEYMGTVSLKHIKDGTAEFGITIRTKAMGKGYSKLAMEEIVKKGFDEMKLDKVYWCVNPDNKRAVRFYDKNNYQRINILNEGIMIEGYTDEQIDKYIWYMIFK